MIRLLVATDLDGCLLDRETQSYEAARPSEAALLALKREYDEPFLLQDERGLERLARAASRWGLKVAQSGRFYHLTGRSDQGVALRTLLAVYQQAGRNVYSAGLGHAATPRC